MLADDGRLAAKRQRQAQAWLWEAIDAELKRWFRAHPNVRAALPDVEVAVAAGRSAPIWAARQLLAAAGVDRMRQHKE